MERREFLELSGSAVAGAVLSNVSVVQAQRPVPKSEYDYVDWSWQKWQKITGATRPRVNGEQTGRAELQDLLTTGGRQITTPKAWATRREELKTLLNVFIGEQPKS